MDILVCNGSIHYRRTGGPVTVANVRLACCLDLSEAFVWSLPPEHMAFVAGMPINL